MEKKILGLDLGTNSIGWAVVNAETSEQGDRLTGISCAGSRIVPMDGDRKAEFEKGNSISNTSERTRMRLARRTHERSLLRRERLHRVLDILGMLPDHFASALDRYGKIKPDCEPKLAWRKTADGEAYEFVFQASFEEMMAEFRQSQPDLLAGGRKIPYDWTIYYLRKKALTDPLTPQELAWVLLHFNQKRGYYQQRSEQEETVETKREEYMELRVVSIDADETDKKGKDTWYNFRLENGLVYRRKAQQKPEWEGQLLKLVVTTEYNEDGTLKLDKDGQPKRSLRLPKEDDWTLLKKKSEADIESSGKSVGAYIYAALLADPDLKVRGKLVQTIERRYYKEELRKILTKQMEFQPQLQDRDLYARCIEALYPSNAAYRESIRNRSFDYLFIDDILFYQRPLKSKKSLIDNCPLESHVGLGQDGQPRPYGVKCIAKSHPLYQEFRLWQFIANLRVYRKADDADVTLQLLPDLDSRAALFDALLQRKTVDQKAFLSLKMLGLGRKLAADYRWNYADDKAYPCGETRDLLLKALKRADVSPDWLTADRELALWHMLYSISDKAELQTALSRYAERNQLPAALAEALAACPTFGGDYGAYSQKAIARLLPLMRCGRHWQQEAIPADLLDRILHLIDGEYDEQIPDRVREQTAHLRAVADFQGLPEWLAKYVVYGRHSEAKSTERWESPADVDRYLAEFRQHSLRNPVVEQVVTETLRVVRDIWKREGHIDEIHVEMGRELKNSADERKRISQRVSQNEQDNLRIKALLQEFVQPEYAIEGVRPFSPTQAELLRIYEQGALESEAELPDYIAAIIKKFRETDAAKRPSHSDFVRYKLWLEQRYVSPYTGEPISLARLFTSDYEIEHVIPQSRFFDDSYSNKVICEAAVNRLKSSMLGLEFIRQYGGERVECGQGREVTILKEEAYRPFVESHFANQREKRRKLLLDDIPEEFIQRQMNDSRYISKLVRSLLSRIVREDDEQEAISKHVIGCVGSITDRLKQDWGVNDQWNRLILPRFERLNAITGTHDYTTTTASGHPIPCMPLHQQRGFQKKRIDHRHHAMDAIVIACAGRNIVNYLNNVNAARPNEERQDLQRAVCDKHKDAQSNYRWVVKLPWPTFPADVYRQLAGMVVSIKQNLRVLTRATNRYQRFVDGKKQLVQQEGVNWAIRKSLHKDTVKADVNLQLQRTVNLKAALTQLPRIVDRDLKKKLAAMLELGYNEKQMKTYFAEHADEWADVNVNRIPVFYYAHETDNERYYASRVAITDKLTPKQIEHITDSAARLILQRHLHRCGDEPAVAFSPEGLDRMNADIRSLNGGRPHKPIYKVRVYEKGNRFALGTTGNKRSKWMEAAKGTNLYFAIYADKQGKRLYYSIPLAEVIARQKQGLSPAPETYKGAPLLMVLSPGSFVYVPTEEQLKNGVTLDCVDKNRIYKMVNCGEGICFFIKAETANILLDKVEYSSQNKMERAITGEQVKAVCLPLTVDRLGNITQIG